MSSVIFGHEYRSDDGLVEYQSCYKFTPEVLTDRSSRKRRIPLLRYAISLNPGRHKSSVFEYKNRPTSSGNLTIDSQTTTNMDTLYGHENPMFGGPDCHAQTKKEMSNQFSWDDIATCQLKQNLTESLDLSSRESVPIPKFLDDDDSIQTADTLFWSAFGSYTRLSDPPDYSQISPTQSLESDPSYQIISTPEKITRADTGGIWAAMNMNDGYPTDSNDDQQYSIDNVFVDDFTPHNSFWDEQLKTLSAESHYLPHESSDVPILKPETCSPQDLSLNYNQGSDVRALFPEYAWPLHDDMAYSGDRKLHSTASSEMHYPPLADSTISSTCNHVSVGDNLFDDPASFFVQDDEACDSSFKPDQLLTPLDDSDVFIERLLSPQSDVQPIDSHGQIQEQLQPDGVSRDMTKDEFLLRCKAQGMSYKEIKVRGNFQEAESTLRGRYRTLTKSKEQRVRKPVWIDHDIATLKQVVAQYLRNPAHGSNSRARHHELNRVPWKLVADNMANRGCYRYGNATVKKKYFEVMGVEQRSESW